MKFSTYTPAVSPNTLHNIGITPTQASRDINAYGGRGGGEQIGALADAAKMGLALQKKITDGKALEANAEYNRLMSEGTSELMQKKEGEALTIADEYDKLQKNVLAQVNKKYGGYLYGDSRESFDAYTMRDDATRRASVVKYQTAQTDAYRETQYNNQLAECRNAAIEGGGDIGAVAGALNRVDAVVESRFGGYGGEKLIEQKRIAAGQIVGDAVGMALQSGNYVKAETLLSTYKGLLPTKDYIEAKTKLQKQQETKREYMAIDQIAASCRGADGKIDLARGYAEIEDLCGPGATRGSVSGADVATAGSVYEHQETPYGRNGCVWAATNIGKSFSPFLQKASQEGIVNVGELLRFAKTEGASVEAYNADDIKPGDAIIYFAPGDALTEENAEHVVLSDGAGGYWGNSSNAGENGLVVHGESTDLGENLVPRLVIRTAQGGSASAYDPEKREKLRRMLKAQADSERALEKRAEEDRMNAMKNEIAGAGDYGTAAAYIESLDADSDTRRRLTSYAAYIYHVPGAGGGEGSRSGKPYNPQKDIKTLNAFNTAITMGENLTAEKWTNMRAASDAILQSGVLTDEAREQIDHALDDETIWSQITAALDSGKDIEDIRDVFMASGMSAEMAMIVLSRIDDRYL